MIKHFFSLLIFFSLFFVAAPYLAAAELTICYTNSLNGFLDYCHCKDAPKGGLVKRATVIKNLRKKDPGLLLLETGDFLHFEKDLLLAEYIIKSYRHINYDAILFGDQEFALGIENFMSYRNKLPFLCNNVIVKRGSRKYPPFKRYMIVKKGKLRVGIIGSLGKKAFRYYSKKITSRVKVNPQVREINKDVRTLKNMGVDMIILLSHSGYEADKKLAAKIKGVALIVGGHSQTLLRRPVRAGRTLIVQAGSNGAHIGILRAAVKNGSIVSFRNSFMLPDDKQPADDPVIRRLINEYTARLKKKYKGLKFQK